MLYLPAAIILSSLIVIAFKYFGKRGIDNRQAIVVNYLVTVICGITSLPKSFIITDIPDYNWFPYAIIAGFTLILVFQVFALSSQKAGIAITAVSSKMSLIIPVAIGIFFYNNEAGIMKIAGIALTILALYLTIAFKKEKTDTRYIFLPLLLFVGNGLNDSLLNHCERFLIAGNTQAFLTIAFAASFLLGMLMMSYRIIFKNEKINFQNIVAGVILGLLNWYSTYYFLKGLNFYSSVVYFPVLNIGIVVLSAITGYFVFKEKLSKANILGIAAAIAAILLITLG